MRCMSYRHNPPKPGPLIPRHYDRYSVCAGSLRMRAPASAAVGALRCRRVCMLARARVCMFVRWRSWHTCAHQHGARAHAEAKKRFFYRNKLRAKLELNEEVCSLAVWLAASACVHMCNICCFSGIASAVVA